MSWDLKIWSIHKAKFPESLSGEKHWDLESGNAYLRKNEWQIVVNNSLKVEDEDINNEVLPLLPGISYLTELNLEPISAPESGKNLLLKIAKSIAKDVVGIIEDPQTNNLIAPSGIKRFIPPKRERDERFSILEMTWWFGDNPLAHKEIIYNVINYFESRLPEALPKRYGGYEPPQHKYIETGNEHLKKYLVDHMYENVVWYPTKPVVGVHLSLVKEWGFFDRRGKKHFGANNFSIEIDASVLNQAGWKELLEKIFKDISLILNPFYGEARILRNKIYGGGTYFVDEKSEESPITGMWTGIPQKLGKAIVVGEPYLIYLPKLKQKGKMMGNFCFLSTDDWSSERSVNNIIGNVPKEIAQLKPHKLFLPFEESLKRSKDEEKFPPIFPFTKMAKDQPQN